MCSVQLYQFKQSLLSYITILSLLSFENWIHLSPQFMRSFCKLFSSEFYCCWVKHVSYPSHGKVYVATFQNFETEMIFRQLHWGTLTASFLDRIQLIIVTDDFLHWIEFGKGKIQQSMMVIYRVSFAERIYQEFSLQRNFHSNIFKASALFETRVGLT